MNFINSLTNIFTPSVSHKKIAVILKEKDSYWLEIEKGVLCGSKEFNIHCDIFWSSAEKDTQGRALTLLSIIKLNYDGVILPLSLEVIDTLNYASKNGMEIIVIDSPIDSEKYTSIISTDNYKAGVDVCHIAAKKLHNEGFIACLNISENTISVTDRIRGFYDTIKEHYPKIKMIPNVYHYGEIDYAHDLVETLLYKEPQLNAVFAANFHGTIGAARHLKESKNKDVLLFGFDNTPEIIRFFNEGFIHSLTIQFPEKMGYISVKQMVNAFLGKAVNKYIDTGTYTITDENRNTEESQKFLLA